MLKFKIGQKLLCIEDPEYYSSRDRSVPKAGEEYTISKVYNHMDHAQWPGYYIYFKELDAKTGWHHRLFKCVVSNKERMAERRAKCQNSK